MSTGFDSLPPWEAATWFQAVKSTLVTTVMTVPTQLVVADPMRVGLIIGSPGGSAYHVAPTPVLLAGFSPGGLVLGTSNPVLMLTFADWGPLVQSDWYTIDSSGGSVWSIIEIRLRDWPRWRMPNGQLRSPNTEKPASRNRNVWPDSAPGG